MSTERELKDIDDKNKCFNEISEAYQKLDLGFMAIGMDYGFHNSGIRTGDFSVFELRDNVKYRIFSSIFHLEFLLKHLNYVERVINEKFKEEPGLINTYSFPHNTIFYGHEREVSSIFDSIIFHISSIYDYMSLLTNYVCGGKKEERMTWIQLSKSVRDKNNRLSKSRVASTIDSIDRQFAATLFDHRSDLIHRESDMSVFRHTFQLVSHNSELQFICSSKLQRRFKKILDSQNDYTVPYISQLLIRQTFQNLANILNALRLELEANSKFPENLKGNKSNLFLVVVDPVTRRALSPASEYWPPFKEFFSL